MADVREVRKDGIVFDPRNASEPSSLALERLRSSHPEMYALIKQAAEEMAQIAETLDGDDNPTLTLRRMRRHNESLEDDLSRGGTRGSMNSALRSALCTLILGRKAACDFAKAEADAGRSFSVGFGARPYSPGAKVHFGENRGPFRAPPTNFEPGV